jgi:hypothetical protein
MNILSINNMETNKKMKKVSPRIVALAVLLLSFIAAGGVGIHKAIAPGGGGFEEETNPTGG